MTRYIALLRGINSSGKNKIAMAELKTAFAGAGFSGVSTYLNSGNIVFSADAQFVLRGFELHVRRIYYTLS